MHHFRLYFLDPDGRILRVEDYSGDDDAPALAEAMRRSSRLRAEAALAPNLRR
jgi:hypothetical protein